MRVQAHRHLQAALRRVFPGSRRDFRVVRAYLRDDMGPTEIARSGIGLSAKGVASLLHRALPRLVSEMKIGRPLAARGRGRSSGMQPRTP